MQIAVIYSVFHQEIVSNLLKGTKKALTEQKIDTNSVDYFEVPGAFEIPLMSKKLAKSKKYDAIITLGCVIKGQTEHYDMICKAVTHAIMEIMLEFEIPIVFEILMVHDINDAKRRANTKNWNENKGYSAIKTALEMLNFIKCI